MKISQREARRLRKRVAELEANEDDRRRAWVEAWPGGTRFWTTTENGVNTMAAIRTARKLGHAVVVVPAEYENTLRFFALPLAKEE